MQTFTDNVRELPRGRGSQTGEAWKGYSITGTEILITNGIRTPLVAKFVLNLEVEHLPHLDLEIHQLISVINGKARSILPYTPASLSHDRPFIAVEVSS